MTAAITSSARTNVSHQSSAIGRSVWNAIVKARIETKVGGAI